MANHNESIAPTSKERKIAAFKENHRGRISRGSSTPGIIEPELQSSASDNSPSLNQSVDPASREVHDVAEDQHETKGRRNVKRENNSRYGRREHHSKL